MRVLAGLFGRQAGEAMRTDLLWRVTPGVAPARDMYNLLAAYYGANGVYEQLRQDFVAAGLWGEGLRGLRNPAFRCVEFYVAHLWPGALPDALPIVTDNESIIEPIEQVWTWSNWAAKKQVAARWLSTFGDLLIKVRANDRGDRVYFQMLDPRIVTDFGKDERGFVTSIRLDVPQTQYDSGGNVKRRYTYVEAWDKDTLTYRTWEFDGDAIRTPLEQLGRPTAVEDMRSFGVDFVPIVHAPFRDTGDLRGVGAFVPVLDKIDELNRVTTRLHQMAFRHIKTLWALKAGGLDANNRPLPAPRLQTTPTTSPDVTVNGNGLTQNVAYLGDDAVIPLPGNSELESLVPNLNYSALLEVATATMGEIETDLPEILWYRLAQEGADISGRAIRLKMAAAAKRVEEARGNAESALARADAMALTIGEHLGLFSGLGTFDGGDFEHVFAERDIFPLTGLDEAEELRAQGQAAQAFQAAGVPLATIATRVMGLTPDDAAEMLGMMASQVDGQVPSGGER